MSKFTETPVAVRLIRCFPDKGPHARLYAIWDTLAEYLQDLLTVRWFANPSAGLRHGQCLNAIWQEEREFDNRYVVFTEHDFLPNLSANDLFALKNFGNKFDAVCATYVTRGTNGMPKLFPSLGGGWWCALDKHSVPKILNFDNQPDPANEIPLQLHHRDCKVRMYRGRARGFFQDYPFGTHLFWSRHYLDNPETDLNCGGLTVGALVSQVDGEISRWLTASPKDFQAVFAKRIGKDELRLAARHAGKL